MVSFIDEYEAARGCSFSAEHRRYIAANACFTLCYIAKCKYSRDPITADASDEVVALHEMVDGMAF